MEEINKKRHSLAHLLAHSTKLLYPGSQNSIGPAVEHGFYQDFEVKGHITEDDLPRIENKMKEVLKTWKGFERKEVDLEEALEIFKDNKYKQELASEFAQEGKTLTIYASGDFVDLCKGGHVEDISSINSDAFKLTKVAGAYWRGDSKNTMLTRIYGVAFDTKEELDNYFKMLEEAKARDHRKLGEELQLFFMSETVGAGLPLMMPRGELIKNELMKYMREKEEQRNYKYVSTPVLAQQKLYERSGHANYYLENMYQTVPDEEGNSFFLKPMNCPHHHMIFEKLVNSYRDLPLRLSEHAGLYRYELSGTLTGLIRMRGPITQNDSHTYVTKDQVETEFTEVLRLFQEVYKETGIHDYWFRLSLPDFSKEKYAGNREHWEWAGDVIRRCLQSVDAEFVEELDEAAFYGPKVDVQVRNVLGREDSIATVQLDIVVPERMDLTYVDSEGKDQYVYVIHKSIMGAFERFMAFLLEQTAGKLPVWLSPEQIRIITLNDEESVTNAAEELVKKAKEHGLRVELDGSNESVGKRIRAAELMKVPYTIVIGGKEVESGQLTPRVRSDLPKLDKETWAIEEFLAKLAEDAKTRK
jgi:threonyl-tRNA synthetase